MNILNAKGDFNLHTHTKYCDGHDDPEELVLRAIELGFKTIGFSGHEYADYDLDVCMTRENTLKYRAEVLSLKEKYAGRIKIRLGIERDYFSEPDDFPYEYIIGSVHYVKKDGVYISVDDTEEKTERYVEDHFGGDFRSYVEAYYDTIGGIIDKTGADIVGHFDIVTKFNEGNRYFDEHSTWYKKAALRALARVARTRPIVEINTGAMARGYRTRPYPDRFILDEADRLGCPIIVSSDCHNKAELNYGFDRFCNI
jgi:histidinol-phosphatase (PHP family)